jgi:uncharacterized membrane protein
MLSTLNVGHLERWASALGGAALTAYGIKHLKDKSIAGAMIAAAGTSLIYRGATGRCPIYAAAGINTANGGRDTRSALSGRRGVAVEEVVRINRPANELFRFWRSFELLPTFMDHLVSVRQVDRDRSHWIAKAPAGQTVEWDAEIINEIPDELIAWKTRNDADVVSAGSVHFKPAPNGGGTDVRVRLQYHPPAGKLGSAVAWMFGEEPSQTIQEDLRRFKRLMEAGEIPEHGRAAGECPIAQ